MELHNKRTHSALDSGAEQLPLKRKVLSRAGSPSCTSRRRSVPRSPFVLAKSSGSAEEDTACDSDFAKKPVVHFKSNPAVSATLLEAVSKYSDSEMDSENDIHNSIDSAYAQQQQLDSSYLLERRKSLSRHPSFSSSTRKQAVPKSDAIAQERCFDYLLQSIDEVWARYCNTTATAEAKVYDSLGHSEYLPDSYSDDREASHALNSSNAGSPSHARTPSFVSVNNFSDDESDDTSGYKSEITNPTEYDTDCDYRKISNLPDSVRLQNLKDRLCRAKNDLEDLHGSTSYDDCARFWRRWDMIKYSAVEMMEEDDDDDVIESVIEEMERGRCFVN